MRASGLGGAGGMDGSGHADVIKSGIGDVTNLQGGEAGMRLTKVTDLQGSDGHGFAKARVRKLL